jgi:hypothetical protein
MRDVEKNLIYKFYLPMVFSALVVQLGLATTILGINRSVLNFMDWDDDENRNFFKHRAGEFWEIPLKVPEGQGLLEEMQLLHARE